MDMLTGVAVQPARCKRNAGVHGSDRGVGAHLYLVEEQGMRRKA
jgi:hypothetical protein